VAQISSEAFDDKLSDLLQEALDSDMELATIVGSLYCAANAVAAHTWEICHVEED
jgi:hypothetical protein